MYTFILQARVKNFFEKDGTPEELWLTHTKWGHTYEHCASGKLLTEIIPQQNAKKVLWDSPAEASSGLVALFGAPEFELQVEVAPGTWAPHGQVSMKRTLDLFFAAAYQHGVDTFEPDHEAGDLQEMLRIGLRTFDRRAKRGAPILRPGSGPDGCRPVPGLTRQPCWNGASAGFQHALSDFRRTGEPVPAGGNLSPPRSARLRQLPPAGWSPIFQFPCRATL